MAKHSVLMHDLHHRVTSKLLSSFRFEVLRYSGSRCDLLLEGLQQRQVHTLPCLCELCFRCTQRMVQLIIWGGGEVARGLEIQQGYA